MLNEFFIEFAGVLASAVTFIMFIPTALSVYRHRHSPASLEGVSASTAWMMVVGSTAWIVYGLGTGAFWVSAPSAVNLPLGVVILVMLARARGMVSLDGIVAIRDGDTISSTVCRV